MNDSVEDEPTDFRWERSHRAPEQDNFRDCSPWHTRATGQLALDKPYSLKNVLSAVKNKAQKSKTEAVERALHRLSHPKKVSLPQHRRHHTQDMSGSFLTAQRELSAEEPVYMSASRLIPQYLPNVSNKRKNVSVVIHLLKSKAVEVKQPESKSTIHNLNNIKVRLMSRKMEHVRVKSTTREDLKMRERGRWQSIGPVEGKKHYPRSIKGYFNNSIYRLWKRQERGQEGHSISFQKY